jgi:plasmid stability protein
MQELGNFETAMATLQIENLPDELYKRIQSLAAENNFSVNEAAIYLLKQAFEPNDVKMTQEWQDKTGSEVLERIRSRPRVNPIDFGLPDSTVLIREDRNR